MIDLPLCSQCGERHVPRGCYLGSGDAAAIIGVANPDRRTAVQVYQSKVEPLREPELEVEVGGVIERGIILEPEIVNAFSRLKGVEVVDRQKFLQLHNVPFPIGSHIDGRLKSDGAIVEAKSAAAGLRDQWGESGSSDVPEDYLVQGVHHLAGAPDAPGVWFPVYFVGYTVKMEWFYVPRDAKFVKDLVDAEIAFAEKHIIPKIPPPAVTRSDVKRLFPKDTGAAVEATVEVALAVDELKRLRDAIDKLSLEKDVLEGKITSALGPAAMLTYAGRTLATFKTQSMATLDRKALFAAHPELDGKFDRQSTFRVLRLKK